MRSFHFNIELLRDVTPRQRSLYRATICLILASGNRPLDFHSRAVLNEQLLASNGIDDHHIFPAHHLDLQGVEARKRDCVLNRCLIDRETNQHISYSAPSEYMAELRDEPGFPMQAVLNSHLIPHGPESGLWTDGFDSFLAQRQGPLWRRLPPQGLGPRPQQDHRLGRHQGDDLRHCLPHHPR